ncbi:MAG: polysaccharide biosynthesis tyrosine autokinase [Flavobacteriaceae bacterium]|nr:polysaccharide biosynthesis tyrosine autokinase [Flavobacteriaceae bacterium]
MANNPYYMSDLSRTFNIKEEAFKYLRKWPWFVATSAVFVVIAFFYLKYSPVIYETYAKIKILDETSKGLELPKDLSSLFESSKVNLENDIEILKSYRLLHRVVEKLNLDVNYYEEGTIKKMELWETPFKVKPKDSLQYESLKGASFQFLIQSNHIEISDIFDEKWHVSGKIYDRTALPFHVIINDTALFYRHSGKNYTVSFHSSDIIAKNLANNLKVSHVGKMSDILKLNLRGENKKKSEAIINEIINQFNLDGIADRQLVSQRTIDFVDARFEFLTEELDSIEEGKKRYKRKNNLSDIKLDTEYKLLDRSNSNKEVIEQETQLELARLLKETLNKPEDDSLLPANIGIDNVRINTLITEYNTLLLSRRKMRISAGENNPLVSNMTDKLNQLKVNIFNSVLALEEQYQRTLKRINRNNQRTKFVFSEIPKKEKFLRSIERQQMIKEALYILLLEKREEAAINLSVTSPSIKIVDYAITDHKPISPKSRSTYLTALFFGLLLPFGVIYIILLLDTKVHTKSDIEQQTRAIAPVIGEVPFIKHKNLISGYGEQSVLAESFRILRTNITHNLGQREKEGGKLIYVTSTIKGEGKTFTALNLALTYASYNKNVLLVGADFRNPKIHGYLNLDRQVIRGLSNYLDDPSLCLEDLYVDYNLNNMPFKILFSGPIPPNVSSLISNGNYEKFIENAKKEFDYVIVDTAPTILVADTLLISCHADYTVYLVRSDFTEKRLLGFSRELLEEEKLGKTGYVINGINPNQSYGYSYNYGYNYGYSMDEQRKKWFKRLFHKS